MSQIAFAILALALLLLAGAAGCQYLAARSGGKPLRQALLAPPDLWSLAVALAGFFAAAFVFLWGFLLRSEPFMRALMNALVLLWLVILGYIDAREKIIPNGLIGLGLGAWVLLVALEIFLGGAPWAQLLVFSAIGGLACGGLLFIIALIAKSALGMGDVKLFFVLGLLYGLSDAYGILLFSVICMGLVSLVLLALKKVTTKSTIPMAPFVVLGFLLSIFAGM